MYTAGLVVSTGAALSQHVDNVYSARACLIIEHTYTVYARPI